MSQFKELLQGYGKVAPAQRAEISEIPSVQDLPPGKHSLLIQKLEAKVTIKQQPIISMIVSTGKALHEHVFWLTNEQAIQQAFADFILLGMSPTADFLATVEGFLPSLVGKRFQGFRKDNQKDGKEFKNFYLNKLQSSDSIARPGQPPAPVAAPAEEDNLDIPF